MRKSGKKKLHATYIRNMFKEKNIMTLHNIIYIEKLLLPRENNVQEEAAFRYNNNNFFIH